ncbi:3'(2'),5'-bisphosphate nucleotidase CysQ [Actinomadura scrupuli]|uniref:3'(2'),5'-bisphosphate nucleotidase CysQ n=1 Tax=Actinomadura scrupuli TaxID=559629 RepID=UPI003D96205D
MQEYSGDDHEVAARLATEAGRLLLRIRAEGGPDVRDAGDRGSHDFLMAALGRARPGDAVLSEEGADDLARLDADRVWIVDPLDGTREFGEEGRPDWAVHVALWRRDATGPGGGLSAGAVALPAREVTLSTAAAGARAGDLPLTVQPPRPGRIRIAVSRTRPPVFVQRMAERLPAEVELVPIGSAGAKISAVLLGEVDAYVHAGGQYEWDSAAPAAVALAAGAHASRVDGTELAYNQKDTKLPDILVCHPSLAPVLLAGIREVSDALPG